jgi:hypothetical protein
METAMSDHVDIVFDGPPGPQSPRLIEVENANGKGIRFGEWIDREDGRWVLRIRSSDFGPRPIIDRNKVDEALRRAAERVRREGPGDGRM